ncbi:MAG: recombination protein RecR [Gammaproteobacteria bacterium]|nr:MAG: recombination protein RecR [Gammaproteobacteria bacterium]
MTADALLEELVEAFQVLPGVGPRTARRMAYHLLERDRDAGLRLAGALEAAMRSLRQCTECRNFTAQERCRLCAGDQRDRGLLCVVESPADVEAVEQTGTYDGLYFVLMGHLSPLDGIGPEALGLDRLQERLARGEVREVILATNPTVEGEATAHFIAQLCEEAGVRATRIAHGVPVGGELEYVDSSTLSHAFADRKPVR